MKSVAFFFLVVLAVASAFAPQPIAFRPAVVLQAATSFEEDLELTRKVIQGFVSGEAAPAEAAPAEEAKEEPAKAEAAAAAEKEE